MRLLRVRGMRAFPLLLSVLLASAPRAVEVPVEKEDMTPRWTPSVYAGTKIGNARIIGQIGVLGPVQQDDKSLLFMDIRGRVDNQSTGEGDFGLGYRRIFGDDRFMLGGYAYFDVLRAGQDRPFVQGTVGLELNSEYWSLRGNGYFPEDRDQVIGFDPQFSEGVQIINNQLNIVSGLGPALVERSIPGFDVELGRRFPIFNQDLWLYAAYYRFAGRGLETVEGPRLRTEFDFDLSRWVKNTTFVVGAEWQHDDVRGSQGYGSLELRFAFGGDKAKGVRRVEGERWTDRRMVSRVVRDIDIMTGTTLAGDPQMIGDAFNPTNGEVYGDIVFVTPDGVQGSGAAGTEADPAHLDDAARLVTPNGVIFVAGDAAEKSINTTGVVLDPTGGPEGLGHDSVQVVGGGTFLDAMAGDGSLHRFLVPGSAPVLALVPPSGTTCVTLETEHCAIIKVTGVKNVRIAGMKLKGGDEGGGILFKDLGGDSRIRNIEIAGSKLGGVAIDGGAGDFLIAGLTVNDSVGTALDVRNTPGQVSISDLKIANGATKGSGLMIFAAAQIFMAGDNSIETTDDAPVLHVTGTAEVPTQLALNALRLDDVFGGSTVFQFGALNLKHFGVAGGAPVDAAVKFSNTTGDVIAQSICVNCQADDAALATGSGLLISESDSRIAILGGFSSKGGEYGIHLSAFNGELQVGGGEIADTAKHGILVENSEAEVVLAELAVLNPGMNGVELSGNLGLFQMLGGSISFVDEGSAENTGLGLNASNATRVELFSGLNPLKITGAGGGAVRVENANNVALIGFEIDGIGDDGDSEGAIHILNATASVDIFGDASGVRSSLTNVAGDGVQIVNTNRIDGLVINVVETDFKNIGGSAIRAGIELGDVPDDVPFAKDLVVEIVANSIEGAGSDGAVVLDYAGENRVSTQNVTLSLRGNSVSDATGDGIVVRASAGSDTSVEINGNTLLGRNPGFCYSDGTSSCDSDDSAQLDEAFLKQEELSAELIARYDFDGDGFITENVELVNFENNFLILKENNGAAISVEIEGDLFHPLDFNMDGFVNWSDSRAQFVDTLSAGLADPAQLPETFSEARGSYLKSLNAPAATEVVLGVEIQGNTIKDWNLGGIAVRALGDAVGRTVNASIGGNTIRNIVGSAGTMSPGVALQASGSVDFRATVDNNSFFNSQGFLGTGTADIPDVAFLRVDLFGNTFKRLSTQTPIFHFEGNPKLQFELVCSEGMPACPSVLETDDDFVRLLGHGGSLTQQNEVVTLNDETLAVESTAPVGLDEVQVDFGGGTFEPITELP